MDFVRNQLTKFKTVGDRDQIDGYDENVPIGPTIGISAGQVKEDVHYMESRGAIDLSLLRFHAFDDNFNYNYNIINNNNSNNNNNNTNPDDGSGGYDYGVGKVESFVDIAVFEVPEHCTSRNCDLSRFGVGLLSHFNGVSYPIMCQAGRLKLDHNMFKGHHTQLMVPIDGPMPDRIQQYWSAKFPVPTDKHYEVLLANCNRKGKSVRVSGQVVFDLAGSRDATVNNLTAESVTILTSVAFLVFLVLTVLAVRVNWGTRSDFVYGSVSSTDGEGDEEEQRQEQSPQTSGDADGTEYEEDEFRDEDDRRGTESGEQGVVLGLAHTTIV